jgi:anti-sigma factor RsiW
MQSQHVPFDQLVELARGQVSYDRRPEVTLHLSTCGACAAELHSVGRLVDLMGTDDGEDAPEHVVARAVRIYGQYHLQPASQSLLRRIIATLRFDSAQQQLAFGARGALPQARHLVFDAEPYDIELRVERSEIGWVVGGQVFGPCTGGQVIATAGGARAEATLNELCEFSLPTLSVGEYTVVVQLRDGEIEVPGLELLD